MSIIQDFNKGKWFIADTNNGVVCDCVNNDDATLEDGLATIKNLLGDRGKVYAIRESTPLEVLDIYKKATEHSMTYSSAYH